ncbi:MAG: MBL fold metallo-hydrolase, partial [Firmicutes bacterium]|nr:MBL fold metallo-hydrolase [Bacillota bacterium]
MRTLTDKLKFEYLLDSAVLIEISGVKALIDGLPSDKNSFDLLPEALEEEIMAGQGEFRGLDCLFFTHCHGDHLSGKKLTSYLERNPMTFVAIPKDAELDFDRFRRGGAEFLIPQGEVAEVHGGRTASGLEFQYMRTGHLTFHCPEHYAYNFLEGDTSVIFTGDM